MAQKLNNSQEDGSNRCWSWDIWDLFQRVAERPGKESEHTDREEMENDNGVKVIVIDWVLRT